MIRRMVVECDVCGEEVGANSYKIIRAKDILNCWDEPVFVFSGIITYIGLNPLSISTPRPFFPFVDKSLI